MAITFRVYPSGNPARDKHYFKVVVFPTKKALYRGYRQRQCVGHPNRRDFLGIVMPVQVEHFAAGRHTIDPFLGYILLSTERLSIEILAHEAAHAGLEYVRRIHKSRDDEELCYAVGVVAHELISRYRNWA